MPSIVSIIGNRRPDNYSAHAATLVTELLRKAGADVEVFDGRTLSLAFPGEPEGADAERLRDAVRAADGVLFATPEYHGTFSAYVKLVIENLEYPSVLSGKAVAMIGVGSGRIGAVKSLEALRGCLAHCGAIVMPHAISIAGVRQVFDENGKCLNPGAKQALAGVADSLLAFLSGRNTV